MLLRGRIIEEHKNYYLVDTARGAVRATLKGVIKRREKRLYAGDIVSVELINRDLPDGIIRSLDTRKNILRRPAVANIDRVILILTLCEPPLDLEFTDRFLFSCGVRGFAVALAFNKDDLLTAQERESRNTLMAGYEKAGYECRTLSALTEEGIGAVVELCTGTLSIFAGPSGVGKSMVLSKIFPDQRFRIGELSRHLGRGVHTTTNIRLLTLPGGGYIADTPGFSHIELPAVTEDEAAVFFPEIGGQHGQCRFANCTHRNEPGCRISELVERGEIMASRYRSYVNIYDILYEKQREYIGPKRRVKNR